MIQPLIFADITSFHQKLAIFVILGNKDKNCYFDLKLGIRSTIAEF